MSSEFLSAATRLCAACGLCCNGVMFHSVELQSLDRAKELLSLGMKLKKKRKQVFILQPCPAHKDSCCAIYDQRPQRCRIFECRQIQLVRSGGKTEQSALEKILDVKARIAGLEDLLDLAGAPNRRRSLNRRYQKVLDDVPDELVGHDVLGLRVRLAASMQQLEEVLENDFRVK